VVVETLAGELLWAHREVLDLQLVAQHLELGEQAAEKPHGLCTSQVLVLPLQTVLLLLFDKEHLLRFRHFLLEHPAPFLPLFRELADPGLHSALLLQPLSLNLLEGL
jgi:hypothetical protein